MNSTALIIPGEKKVISQFNARRIEDSLRFGAEKEHLATIIRADAKGSLLKCQPDSFGEVMLQAAVTGLSLNPMLAYAYVIPEGGRATLKPSYKGMMHLCAKSGVLRGAPQANVVRQHDPVFEVSTVNGVRQVKHVEGRGERGAVTHAYCIAHFRDGGMHVEVMDQHDLAAVMEASTSRNPRGGAVWRSKFSIEMCKKSVIRRAWKWWPKDPALEHAVEVMNQYDPIDFGQADDAVSAEPEVCISDDQELQLRDLCTAAGVPDADIGRWLERLAQRYGLADIRNLPASRFDSVSKELSGYLDQWKERQHAAG